MASKVLRKVLKFIPSKVRITRTVSYEIVFIKTLCNDTVLGECRFDSKQIVINENQSDSQKISCIIHEIFHAISLEHNIDLTETQVLKLEKGAYNFFRLNKLFDFLSKLP